MASLDHQVPSLPQTKTVDASEDPALLDKPSLDNPIVEAVSLQ